MDRSTARLVVVFTIGVLAGTLVGFESPGALSDGSGRITDDLEGNTVWVGGTLGRIEGSAIHVNTSRFVGEPVPVDVTDAALFTCSPRENGLSCDPLSETAALSRGDAVCVSARADSGGLVAIKLFANATCSLAPA